MLFRKRRNFYCAKMEHGYEHENKRYICITYRREKRKILVFKRLFDFSVNCKNLDNREWKCQKQNAWASITMLYKTRFQIENVTSSFLQVLTLLDDCFGHCPEYGEDRREKCRRWEKRKCDAVHFRCRSITPLLRSRLSKKVRLAWSWEIFTLLHHVFPQTLSLVVLPVHVLDIQERLERPWCEKQVMRTPVIFPYRAIWNTSERIRKLCGKLSRGLNCEGWKAMLDASYNRVMIAWQALVMVIEME